MTSIVTGQASENCPADKTEIFWKGHQQQVAEEEQQEQPGGGEQEEERQQDKLQHQDGWGKQEPKAVLRKFQLKKWDIFHLRNDLPICTCNMYISLGVWL